MPGLKTYRSDERRKTDEGPEGGSGPSGMVLGRRFRRQTGDRWRGGFAVPIAVIHMIAMIVVFI